MAAAARPPRQLPLSLPHRPALSRGDFLVGASNEAALSLVERWPDWPGPAMFLWGPPGAGKTHLVEIWRTVSRASVASAAELASIDADALIEPGAAAIENVGAPLVGEAALFHLLNRAQEKRTSLLMTGQSPPSALRVALPDLASRLRALHAVELRAPDDDLIRRVLTKLFADRQLAVEPGLIEFLLRRMQRSLAAAGRLVESLDAEALAFNRPLTRPLAAAVLDRLTEDNGADEPDNED